MLFSAKEGGGFTETGVLAIGLAKEEAMNASLLPVSPISNFVLLPFLVEDRLEFSFGAIAIGIKGESCCSGSGGEKLAEFKSGMLVELELALFIGEPTTFFFLPLLPRG